MKKYRLELTEHQLMLLARCTEDCSRFIAGQMEMWNSTSYSLLKDGVKLRENLKDLQPFVTPDLPNGASYGWSGGPCENENQRKFIAETYYLYREIYHIVTKERSKEVDMGCNVYLGSTLRCKDSGEPIKVEPIE